MTDTTILHERLAELRKIRAMGARTVRQDNEEVTFRSDSELAAAIADVERQIQEATGRKLPCFINIRSRKGW
ncbi:MAG: hypothetical protein AAGJ94_06050 [Pseudomonadota bacterium]